MPMGWEARRGRYIISFEVNCPHFFFFNTLVIINIPFSIQSLTFSPKVTFSRLSRSFSLQSLPSINEAKNRGGAFLSFCSNFANDFHFFSSNIVNLVAPRVGDTFKQIFVRLIGLQLCLSECQRSKSVLQKTWESKVFDATLPEGGIHTHLKEKKKSSDEPNNCLPTVLCVHCLVWGTF